MNGDVDIAKSEESEYETPISVRQSENLQSEQVQRSGLNHKPPIAKKPDVAQLRKMFENREQDEVTQAKANKAPPPPTRYIEDEKEERFPELKKSKQASRPESEENTSSSTESKSLKSEPKTFAEKFKFFKDLEDRSKK